MKTTKGGKPHDMNPMDKGPKAKGSPPPKSKPPTKGATKGGSRAKCFS